MHHTAQPLQLKHLPVHDIASCDNDRQSDGLQHCLKPLPSTMWAWHNNL